MKEVVCYYLVLCQVGCDVSVVDVGGGLGVDYEGICFCSFCFMNYFMEEYVYNILVVLWEICVQDDLLLLDVILEFGWVLMVYYVVLVSNVIGVESLSVIKFVEFDVEVLVVLQELVCCFYQIEGVICSCLLLELYFEVVYCLGEVQDMYIYGVLILE